jgi:RimJ/RimL family protein N-acetyltransferase
MKRVQGAIDTAVNLQEQLNRPVFLGGLPIDSGGGRLTGGLVKGVTSNATGSVISATDASPRSDAVQLAINPVAGAVSAAHRAAINFRKGGLDFVGQVGGQVLFAAATDGVGAPSSSVARAVDRAAEVATTSTPRLAARPLTAADAPAVRDLYLGLSPASMTGRVGAPSVGRVENALDLNLPGLQNGSYVAVGAFKGDRLVGEASYVPIPGKAGVAERAVTIADDAQGQGLGPRLVRELAVEAEKNGIRTFQVHISSDNIASRKMAAKLGLSLRWDREEQYYVGTQSVDSLLRS